MPIHMITRDYNYFCTINQEKSICDAVYQPDGDTFQNSPIKLVFFSAIHSDETIDLKFSSISKLNVSPSDISFPSVQPKENGLSNMTIINEHKQCIWPRQIDLQDLLFLLGYNPFQTAENDFPWNIILSLFNNQDIKESSAFKAILQIINFDFLYDNTMNFHQNLREFKQFFQFISPISCSATEGNHRIEVANRLLYGIELKEEAPFLKSVPSFVSLPSGSTVVKPISACVYLPHKKDSSLSIEVASHLQCISRKIANQEDLYIKGS